jgi:hypothetical protein
MHPIACLHCHHPYRARPDGHFGCPCGRVITAADLDLDPGEVWAVDPTGTLGYASDPTHALTALADAVEELRTADDCPRPDVARSYARAGIATGSSRVVVRGGSRFDVQ